MWIAETDINVSTYNPLIERPLGIKSVSGFAPAHAFYGVLLF
jgi:hypothetical protein